MDERPSRVGATDLGLVSRRTINLGAAWSVPVVLAAVAAPAAQGSTNPQPGVEASATFGAATGEKGEAVGPNRQVFFSFVFTGVTGTNTIQLTAITEGPWTTLPTEVRSFTADAGSTRATVVFTLERPDNNAATTVDITYLLNGASGTATRVSIKNKARN